MIQHNNFIEWNELMENFLLSLNVVAPLILFMAAGFLLRHIGGIQEQTFTELSKLVFFVCIPALCCDSLRSMNLVETFTNPIGLYIAVSIIVIFTLAALIVPRFSSSPARRGVLVNAVYRSNNAVFALPVATALLKESSMAPMMLCVAITVLLYNTLSVLIMEYYRSGKLRIGKAFLRVITNPVIIGCTIGILLGVFQIPLPSSVAKSLSGLAASCTPLGFLALGGGLSFRFLSQNKLAISVSSLFKLFIIPAAALVLLYMAGVRDDSLLISMVILGAPTAMSIYPMACSMEGDHQLAGGVVAFTSALSPLTMFLFIFILKQAGVV